MVYEMTLELTPFETEIINRLYNSKNKKYDPKSTFEGTLFWTIMFRDGTSIKLSLTGADNFEEYEQILTEKAICTVHDANSNPVMSKEHLYTYEEDLFTPLEFSFFGENTDTYRLSIKPAVN